MSFTINISKNGKHLLTTAENTAESCKEASELYELLRNKFPINEGYCVEIYRTMHVHEDVTDQFELDHQEKIAKIAEEQIWQHVPNIVNAVKFLGIENQQMCYDFIGDERSRCNGFYDVVVYQNPGEERKLAREGEWIVKDATGHISTMSHSDFIHNYRRNLKKGGKR